MFSNFSNLASRLVYFIIFLRNKKVHYAKINKLNILTPKFTWSQSAKPKGILEDVWWRKGFMS
jgi:hypothetical protein